MLMLAAGFGCIALPRPLSFAQSASNFIALHTGTTATSTSLQPCADKINEPIHFCGEALPTNHPEITERWTRTLSQQAALAGRLASLKRRASVVFPLIEPILKQYQIPADFKFLPLLESALTNRAISRRGAAGFWQLMPQTAQSLGLTVSRRSDERFNLRKATHAACRYLHELHNLLGSWMLVATAYNAGPNYIGQLSRQHPFLHPMALPYRAAETKAYLFQAIAVKELITRPQAYSTYLNSQHMASLSDETTPVPSAERATILASFDMSETAFSEATTDELQQTLSTDSTSAVALLPGEGEAFTLVSDSVEIKPEQVVAVAETVSRLKTRCLSEGPLTEGQLCLFQVVQPIVLNDRTFAVGDVIQAHVEVIDAASGRIFLRTDQLTTAQTQETFPLKLVATEQPRHPGVALPTHLASWQLTWEKL